MSKYTQIGALVEKEDGLRAYNDISNSHGALYAFLETGRSDDLYSEKQFGEFGEAAILSMVVEANEKNSDEHETNHEQKAVVDHSNH